MKYKYRLIIEDTKEDVQILELAGAGTTRNKITCLKSIRRSINSAIKDLLETAEKEDTQNKE